MNEGLPRDFSAPVLGYVCEACGWWIQYAMTEDAHCRHLRLAQEEHLPPTSVIHAKARAILGRAGE